MRNQHLFNEVAEYYRQYPETHNQFVWANYTECGTYRCILGTAIHLEGLEDHAYIAHDYAVLNNTEVNFSNRFNVLTDGAKLFGITGDEAKILFAGSWEPKGDLLLVEALEKLGAGMHLQDVTDEDMYNDYTSGKEIDSSHI
jgi:hypothetical protein